MVLAKALVGVAGVTGVLFVVNPTFRNKFDRNILRPIRDYRYQLQYWNQLQTQDEFYKFLNELSTGVFRMVQYESDE